MLYRRYRMQPMTGSFESQGRYFLSEMQAEFEPAVGGDANSFIAPVQSKKRPAFLKGLLPFRSVLERNKLLRGVFSSERGLNQGLFSLADQGVASITNFVTGVIIARATSKQEFGLYMLAFTLILTVTDIQTSLIATPYMVYGPRLKGRAQALYAGSTLLHQIAFSLVVMLAIGVGAVLTRYGLGPAGIGPVLWVLLAVISLIIFREFVRRICFARLKVGAALAFDTVVGIGQVGGLLLCARLGL